MKITAIALLPLLLCSPLDVSERAELRFAPAEELALQVTFRQSSQLELVGSESLLTSGGVEQELTAAPEFEVVRRSLELVVFTDEFIAVGDERPLEFHRAFEEIRGESKETVTDPEAGEEEYESETESSLVGTTVRFRWDEDDEEYATSFADDDGDEDLLEGLRGDGHLSELLPAAEVEEGEEWEIPAAVFAVLFAPGGELPSVPVGEEISDADAEAAEDFAAQYREALEGEFVAEYQGTREEEGVEVAVIALSLEISTSVVREAETAKTRIETTIEGTVREEIGFEFELEGELLWNVGSGHAHALLLEGDQRLVQVSVENYEGNGHYLELTTTFEFEGTLEVRYTFE